MLMATRSGFTQGSLPCLHHHRLVAIPASTPGSPGANGRPACSSPKQEEFPYNLEMPELVLDVPREPSSPCLGKGPGARVCGEYCGVC